MGAGPGDWQGTLDLRLQRSQQVHVRRLPHAPPTIVAPQTSQTGVVAYDKRTGALQWKSAALSGIPGYVTPAIVKVAGGAAQALAAAQNGQQTARGSVRCAACVEDQHILITGAAGCGRTAHGGSVNGLDTRTGAHDLATAA